MTRPHPQARPTSVQPSTARNALREHVLSDLSDLSDGAHAIDWRSALRAQNPSISLLSQTGKTGQTSADGAADSARPTSVQLVCPDGPWGALLERAAAVLRARAARTVARTLRAGLVADAAQLDALRDALAGVTPADIRAGAACIRGDAHWRDGHGLPYPALHEVAALVDRLAAGPSGGGA